MKRISSHLHYLKNKLLYFFNHYNSLLLIVIAISFSTWLMFATFSYSHGQMHIASKAWSDFASHIPLIRSFSFGSNFPPQYPLFSGPPIKYHFLFYAFVGLLEKIGLPLDYALNIPSVVGFAGLLITQYLLAKLIFSSKSIAIISVIFFLFNGTLSFVYFFNIHPISTHTLADIMNSTRFASFGPYDKSIVSAFWNLNIYTNQRHFTLGLALSLMAFIFFLKPIFSEKKLFFKTSIIIGILFGLSFFYHLAIFIMTVAVLFMLAVFYRQIRLQALLTLFIACILAIPQYLYMNPQTNASASSIAIRPGYLIADNLTVIHFLSYWFYNFGLHLIFMLAGFVIAPIKIKKVFIAFFVLFIIGNTFQFSKKMPAKHKFFNLFMLVGVMYSSYFLVTVWKKFSMTKPFILVSFFFLILSGILDFFPVANDSSLTLDDYPKEYDIHWIMKNTPTNSVFFNTSFLFDKASIAGRKVFLGWPYFAWSQGYNTDKRFAEVKYIMQQTNSQEICNFLKANNINYVALTQTSEDFPYDPIFWNKFLAEYENKATHLSIISTKTICLSD